MKYVTGDRYWAGTDEIKNKFEYLSKDLECDVLIVGAGVTGALCSYYFSDIDAKVVVIDKNIIGYQSTCISTSILQYEIDTDFVGLKGIRGEKQALKAFKLCQQTVHSIKNIVDNLDEDCEFSLRDCFYYTNKNGDLKNIENEYELRNKHGFNVEYIDKNAAKKMFSFPVKGGIYTKGASAEINPYKFAKALINKAVSLGTEVYENTELKDFICDENGVEAITKNGFKIKCKKLIIATGYEARKLIKKRTTILTRSFTLVTKPVTSFKGWHNRCIIRDSNTPYMYLRTTEDDRIIAGGEDIDIGGDRSTAAVLSQTHQLSTDKYNKLETILKSMFPEITDIEIEYKFSGIFGETSDGLPYVGEYEEYPNCYFNLGYGSNGILYSAMGADMLKKLYCKENTEDLKLFSFDR
ncbi:NAD(P)/FAD-dependent oxidoreductase [Abyssisolibacter fermentans]|uniref:NAD(P)/FAD-dependent oxidoreductase n=1 Tax=Abyssisolibacter fermentans TaxID=1766203 RepID=UPI0008306ACD|nr:FAD-dependent oxidoreductase [Abyssisolibacter fermentans]